MRTRIAAGNWKMHTDAETAGALAGALAQELGDGLEGAEVVLCPPFPLLSIVAEKIRGTRLKVGAQTLHDQKEGAFTGEVSGRMLRSVGCEYVIVGHSERRMMFAESDLDVSRRTNAALEADLRPIICVGETERERTADRTANVVERQVRAALDGVFEFNVHRCVFAYEPIWAIGTDNAATPEQASAVHAMIRDTIAFTFGNEMADRMQILYGGSLKPANAGPLFAQPQIDGGLIGGASLNAASFAAIVRASVASIVAS